MKRWDQFAADFHLQLQTLDLRPKLMFRRWFLYCILRIGQFEQLLNKRAGGSPPKRCRSQSGGEACRKSGYNCGLRVCSRNERNWQEERMLDDEEYCQV